MKTTITASVLVLIGLSIAITDFALAQSSSHNTVDKRGYDTIVAANEKATISGKAQQQSANASGGHMNNDEEIDASISCMGYGYEVKVFVNGADIGVKGGKSESKRLFGANHSMRNEAPPEMRAQLFVLKRGPNKIHVEYKKTGGKDDRLTFEVYMDKPEPAVTFTTSDPSGKFDKTVEL